MTGKVVKSENPKVLLRTNIGDIVVELDSEKSPITVENFLQYVNKGHYNGTIFHRVIDGFVIQGGGLDKEGNEKPTSTPIKLESYNGLSNVRGSIAMARTMVPDSATSQFFINLVDNNMLDYSSGNPGYAVFGKVIEGMDVVDKIAKVQTDANDRPLEDIVIIKAELY